MTQLRLVYTNDETRREQLERLDRIRLRMARVTFTAKALKLHMMRPDAAAAVETLVDELLRDAG